MSSTSLNYLLSSEYIEHLADFVGTVAWFCKLLECRLFTQVRLGELIEDTEIFRNNSWPLCGDMKIHTLTSLENFTELKRFQEAKEN